MRVVIDPRARLPYAWFYIQGIMDRVGRGNVRFEARPFSGLEPSDRYSYERYFAFQIADRGQIRRYVVDFGDGPQVDKTARRWADVYAKVNIHLPHARELGIVPLGPSFGLGPAGIDHIRAGVLVQAMLSHKHKGAGAWSPPDARRLVGEYRHWHRLPDLGAYAPGSSRTEYGFYLSTLWASESGKKANAERASFMRSSRLLLGSGFEGGFVVRRHASPQSEHLEDLLYPRRVPQEEWIKKTQRSVAVFNNPAVLGCFGWKLPQFMALGKAIISMPITYELPHALVHGTHIHFLRHEEEIPAAIARIRLDHEYRRRLERGSRCYWEDHLSPARATEVLLRG